MVSRNRTIAFLVGAAGFIGSKVAKELLEKGIQVIGVDDFSTGSRGNLKEVVKHKDFHLINANIDNDFFSIDQNLKEFDIPRLDYAFFIADDENNQSLYNKGILNFLNICKFFRDQSLIEEKEAKGEKLTKKDLDLNREQIYAEKPRVALVSSIELYDPKAAKVQKGLKEAEIRFAKFVKYYKLNGRVVRLAPVYGPGMHFRVSDPMTRLIQAELLGSLKDESTVLDFSTRAIYIDDAVNLVIKAVLSGSTAEKIYDGARIKPLKASDIKQVLLDPVWHETQELEPGTLPELPTPNLIRTMKELSWRPKAEVVKSLKETIAHFKENGEKIPEITSEPTKREVKRWSFAETEIEEDREERVEKAEIKKGRRPFFYKLRSKAVGLLVVLIIFFGIFYPVGSLIIGSLTIRHNLQVSRESVERAEFDRALSSIKNAKATLSEITQIMKSLAVVERLNLFKEPIGKTNQLLSLTSEGIEGARFALMGSKALYDATKIISGESDLKAEETYTLAQTNLTRANELLTKVQSRLEDGDFINQYHPEIRMRALDFANRLKIYSQLVEKARVLSLLIPSFTAVNSEKSYLVLIQDNLELRPGGGVVTSAGKLDFKDGRLVGLKIDDVSAVDNRVQESIVIPQEVRSDLEIEKLELKNISYEPDFPTTARNAEFIYKKATGEAVNGAISLDLTALAELIKGVGGIKLSETGQQIEGDDLINKYLEAKNNPSVKLRKHFLTLVANELLNKMFFVPNKNWPGVITSADRALKQKNIQMYLEDTNSLSLLVSENWAGVMPRGLNQEEGSFNDLLAIIENNIGLNQANFYLEKKVNFKTVVNSEDSLSHLLQVRYKNSSVSETAEGSSPVPTSTEQFVPSVYKARVKLYLPVGAKVSAVTLNGSDILKEVNSYSDYGRLVNSFILEVAPKEEKVLLVEYSFVDPLKFKDNKLAYKLDILKQAGSAAEGVELSFVYPEALKAASENADIQPDKEEGVRTSFNLNEDKSFVFNFTKD